MLEFGEIFKNWMMFIQLDECGYNMKNNNKLNEMPYNEL